MGIGEPFGYLRASHGSGKAYLVMLPYNYPLLLSLLAELQRNKYTIVTKWRHSFEKYLLSIPFYYIHPLRLALKRFKVANLIPGSLSSSLNYNICNYLKKVKEQSAMESI